MNKSNSSRKLCYFLQKLQQIFLDQKDVLKNDMEFYNKVEI